jgi:CSLREA domain-containing protein
VAQLFKLRPAPPPQVGNVRYLESAGPAFVPFASIHRCFPFKRAETHLHPARFRRYSMSVKFVRRAQADARSFFAQYKRYGTSPVNILFQTRRFSAFIITASVLTAASAGAVPVPVTNTNNAFAGSLRQAIQDANPGDTIVFQIPTTDPGYNSSTATFTITLTSTATGTAGAGLLIDKSLTIDAGTQNIVVRRSTAGGTPLFHIFRITAGPVTLNHLTISDGKEDSNAGNDSNGGGIGNIGANLTVNNCTFSNNGGTFGAGAIHQNGGVLTVNTCTFASNSTTGDGGAIYLNSKGDVNNTTFSANSSGFGSGNGGAIFSVSADLTVSQSTFAQNTAGHDGGAILKAGGTLTITNSTLSGNTSSSNAGGIVNGAGGAVHARNNIIAGNFEVSTPFDVMGAFASDGYNFIGVGDGSTGFGTSGSHDQVGSNMNPANPSLGPLQNNGGATLTMRPLTGSLVIDQGKSGALPNDQRGQPRVVDQPGVINPGGGDGSDIGAVEVGLPQTGTSFTVTNVSDHDDGLCTSDDCTLREALNVANANADNTISFAPGVTGAIQLATALPNITGSVVVQGPGPRVLTVQRGAGAATGFRVFTVAGSFNATISGLTIANGNLPGGVGGGIYNSANLTLSNDTISGNIANAGGNGGGVFNDFGTVTITNSTLSANSVSSTTDPGSGGAIFNKGGTLTLTNSTLYGNSAIGPDGTDSGGGILSNVGNVTLTNTTVSGNRADLGGGLRSINGAVFTVRSTIVAKNTSPAGSDVNGAFASDRHNFIGTVVGSTGFTANDLQGDPNLAGLANNGGPTDTMELAFGSAAINGGNGATAPPTDQRGYLRSGVSDIGAFEFNGTVPVLKITSITHLPNGRVTLQGRGVANSVHTIQAASDPNAVNFGTIGTATANASGILQYDDASAVGLTKRFYRLSFP